MDTKVKDWHNSVGLTDSKLVSMCINYALPLPQIMIHYIVKKDGIERERYRDAVWF